MAVPSSIADLDAVAANNSPAGSDAIGTALDDYLRAHASIIKQVSQFTQSGSGAVSSTVETKLRESVSIKDFGAVGNGVADDGPALQLALNYCKLNTKKLHATAGTYLINTAVTISAFAGVHIEGDGINNTLFNKTTAGDMLTLDGCSRGVISGIAFSGAGMSSGNGLVISGAGVGVMNIKDNQFASFPGSGLYLNGTVGNPFSGMTVSNNVILSCGITSGVAGFRASYCNDFRIIGNQFGTVSIGGSYPIIGSQLDFCQAGNYSENFHWENLVGAQFTSCVYSRFIGNRFETNQREGVKFIDTSFCTFVGNTIHTNSQGATNTYDGMSMANCGQWAITGNNWFEWSGGATLMRYCLTTDASCNTLMISDNLLFGYGTAPANIASAYEIRLLGNAPLQFGLDQASNNWFTFNSKVVAAGVTTFCGASGASFTEADVTQVAPKSCVATKLRVNLGVAPGAGQTCTVTLRKGGVDTAMAIVLSGAAAYTAEVNGSIPFSDADSFSLKVVNGAGAASTYVSATLVVDN